MPVSLLDSEAASERACDRSVTAAHSTYIASRSTNTVEIVRHGNTDGEILLFGLRKAIGSRNVVSNLQGRELRSSIASLVKIALVRASTISVDLNSLNIASMTLCYARLPDG